MIVTDIKQKDVPDEHHVPRSAVALSSCTTSTDNLSCLLSQGEWLPQSHDTHQKWVKQVIDHVDQNPVDFHPTIKGFEKAVETCVAVAWD
jgi:hypothetical protein